MERSESRLAEASLAVGRKAGAAQMRYLRIGSRLAERMDARRKRRRRGSVSRKIEYY